MGESTSVRDEIEAAWEAHESGDAVAKDGPALPELDSPDSPATDSEKTVTPEVKAAPETETEKPVVEKRKPGRPRKDETTPAVDATAATTDAQPPIEAPHSWAAAEKAEFAKLPRQTQETIARREYERDRALYQGREQISQLQRKYSGLDQVLAPHEDQWMRQGIQPAQVVGQFLAWQKYLDSDPSAALRQLAQSYGLDLAQVAQTAPQVDPEIQRLRSELNNIQAALGQRDEGAAQEYSAQLEQGIEQYAQEKSTDGKPLRPYFAEVWQDMLPIVSHMANTQPNLTHRQILDASYDKAMWMNPQIRERVLQEKAKTDEAKRMSEANEKAQRAKAAAVSVRGSPSGTIAPQAAHSSVRESLLANWDALT